MATRMMPSTAPPLASRCRRTPLTVAAHPRDSTVRVSRGSELHGGGAKYLAASRPHAGHSSDEIVRLRADKVSKYTEGWRPDMGAVASPHNEIYMLERLLLPPRCVLPAV